MPSQEEALRDEVRALQQALRALRRDAAAAAKAARDHEASERERCLADLRARMERERDEQLRQQRAALERSMDKELLAELRRRDAQHRGALASARRLERELQMRLRDAERQALEASNAASVPCGQCANYSRLQQDAAMLHERVQTAESRLEVCTQADREKAEEIRKMSDQHAEELSRLKREATMETQRLLDELRAKQRAVTQLERDLHDHASRLQIQADCLQAARSADGSMGSMRDWAKDSTKKSVARRELESLQRLLEDREQEIAALRQAAKEKDHKLDQLTSRYRREQMRHYYRQFVELEPVAELEEDSELEGSTASSGSPALSPAPGNGWSKMARPSYHEELYLELLREHSELQEAYQRAQFDLRLLHRLEAELAQVRAQARDLRRALRDAAAAGRSARNDETKLAEMQAENAELREQNELLEFRILEVENVASGRCAEMRDASTDTEPDYTLDWSLGSLQSLEDVLSEADQGVHDMMSCEHEELRMRLLHMAKRLQDAPDRSCVLQAMAALDAHHNKHILLGRGPCENSGRAIATVLPFKEAPGEEHPKLGVSECLQESGIFEEDDLEGVSQATQTEFGPSPLGDLRAEIQKLTQIREKIEERGELLPGHQRRTTGDCDTAHECCRKLHDQASRQHSDQSSLLAELQTIDISKLGPEDEAKGRVRELEERERAYQATMLRAEEMMAELQEHYAGLLGGAQRVEGDLRRQLEVCEEENDRLRWRLEELERSHTALSDRLQKGEEERGRLRADAEQLQRELEQCREEVAAPLRAAMLQERRLCQSLRSQLDDMHHELARTDKEHKEKTNDLKKQLGDAQKTAVDYECTISELREEVDTLEVAVTELGAELSRQQSQERTLRAELEALRAELELKQPQTPGASLERQPSVHEELVMLDQLELAMAELDSGVEDFLEADSTVRQTSPRPPAAEEHAKQCVPAEPETTKAAGKPGSARHAGQERKQAGSRGTEATRVRKQRADPKTPSPPPRQHSVHSVKEFLLRPPASALPEDCKRAVRAAMEARRELAGSGLNEAVLHVRSCANCSCVLKSLLSAISEKMRDLSNIMVSKKSEPLALDVTDKVPKMKAEVAANIPRAPPPSEAVDDSCSEGSPRPNRPRRRLRSPPRQKPQWPQVTTSQWQC